MSALPRTLFLARGSSGIAWYRCVLPASALGADWAGALGKPPGLRFVSGVTEGELGYDTLFGYDVVIVQQAVGEQWFSAIRELQRAGVKVLFEVDDYLQAVRKIETHELKGQFDKEWVASAELNMRIADGVICSTPFLARRYRKFNERIWVCQNGIDLKRYTYARQEREHVTIGWAGGVGHIASVRPWLPAVAAVLRARPEVRFTTVGSGFAGELVEEFGPERCRSLPFAPIEVYPASMSTFDVALAPSGNNNLFRGKSDLRWLEASALGIPVVGDPEVYPELAEGDMGLPAASAQEAEAALLALVDDRVLRRRLGDAAHAHVVEHRRIEVAAQRWAEVLREVCPAAANAA